MKLANTILAIILTFVLGWLAYGVFMEPQPMVTTKSGQSITLSKSEGTERVKEIFGLKPTKEELYKNLDYSYSLTPVLLNQVADFTFENKGDYPIEKAVFLIKKKNTNKPEWKEEIEYKTFDLNLQPGEQVEQEINIKARYSTKIDYYMDDIQIELVDVK